MPPPQTQTSQQLELLRAIKNAERSKFFDLLTAHPDICENKEALIFRSTVTHGDFSMIEALIDKNCHQADIQGCSNAFFAAAARGDTVIIERLIDCGYNTPEDGAGAYHCAEHPHTVSFLESKNFVFSPSSFYWCVARALEHHNIELLNHFLNHDLIDTFTQEEKNKLWQAHTHNLLGVTSREIAIFNALLPLIDDIALAVDKSLGYLAQTCTQAHEEHLMYQLTLCPALIGKYLPLIESHLGQLPECLKNIQQSQTEKNALSLLIENISTPARDLTDDSEYISPKKTPPTLRQFKI